MESLKDAVVLITGSSSGIGRGTAVQFAKLGSKLSLHGRDGATLEETASLCVETGASKDNILTDRGDLTDESIREKLINKTIEKFGRLDVLVNNAGAVHLSPTLQTPNDKFDSTMEINLKAPFALTKLAAPHLIKSKGCIVNVSSLSAEKSMPEVGVYCMSKAALDMFTECICLELAPKGVRVNSVNPGVIVSNIARRESDSPYKTDEGYAEVIMFSRGLLMLKLATEKVQNEAKSIQSKTQITKPKFRSQSDTLCRNPIRTFDKAQTVESSCHTEDPDLEIVIIEALKGTLLTEPIIETIVKDLEDEPKIEILTESFTEETRLESSPTRSAIDSLTEPRIESLTEPRIESLTEPRIESLTEPRIESLTETEPRIESLTEPRIESLTEPRIESLTEPRIESVTEPRIESLTEPRIESLTETEPRIESVTTEPRIESVTETEPRIESLTEPRIESLTEPRIESLTEPRIESVTKPRIESVPETEPRIESLTEPRIEREPRIESLTEPRIESLTEPRTESLTEPRIESLTEPRIESLTEPRTESLTEPRIESLTEPRIESLTEPRIESLTETRTESLTDQGRYIPESESSGDDYDSDRDPEYQPPKNQSESEAEEIIDQIKRLKRKRRESNPDIWNKNIQKQRRMEGKSYKGLEKKEGKWVFGKDRQERLLTPRTCSKKCEKNKECAKISDEDRSEILSGFWQKLDWNERQLYVNSLIQSVPVQRRTAAPTASRRNVSHKYFLRKNEERVQVCKSLFLSTLGIGEKTVYAWLSKVSDDSYGMPEKTPNKRRREARRSRDANLRESADNFLDKLPKLESHYCRSTSSKMYLEPTFHTFSEVYQTYKNDCAATGETPASSCILKAVFNEKNIGLFNPKKDQCDLCCGYEVGNISQQDYEQHQAHKEAARKEKSEDKARCQENPEHKVITIDLQSVLLSPKLHASALYYKTKLACHNFTIFDLTTADVMCYFWHEAEGDLTANSFASCLYDYIINILKDNQIKSLTIYSDGCSYQNRNAILSNTLIQIATAKNIDITHKYLIKGHTQMEVDSVHSVIERKIKNSPIYTPQNYVDIIKCSRPRNPYQVKYVDFSFFKKFSTFKFYSSIRPGSKVGDPTVTNIRVLHYNTDGTIQFKLDFNEPFQDLPRKAKLQSPPRQFDIPPPLHSHRLPIKQSKYSHLQELKSVIPKDYHAFYDAIPNA